jgi:predicted nucleotidyltransferase
MLIYNTERVCLVRVLLGQVRENNRCQEAQTVTFGMDEDFIAFGVDEEKDQGGDSGESAAPALLTSIPAPWLAYGYQYDKRAPPFVRLHNEILTCCEYIAPSLHEMKQREIVLAEITDIIQSLWPKSTVQVFGSQMTKILTPTSDLDLVVMGVVENKRDSTEVYLQLAEKIKDSGAVSYVEAIVNAKVPIVKLDHRKTGIAVDICINNDSGLRTGRLIRQFVREYPPLRPMVLVLKIFLVRYLQLSVLPLHNATSRTCKSFRRRSAG